MCDVDPRHDGPAPPPGEAWCQVRLGIELFRYYSGWVFDEPPPPRLLCYRKTQPPTHRE